MNDNDFALNELVEREANIWACIYRAVNRKKDNNEFDEEEENSDIMPITRYDFSPSHSIKFFHTFSICLVLRVSK